MALKIARGEVSNRAWGDVDKSAIWQRLKQALQDGESGAAAAVREVYAVVKAEINADLTQADCWGPHHEVRQDGTVVLNRNGLIAAAQALAGARAEPDLTPEQRRQAARHLLRHYRELELEPPESLLEAAGQATGEMDRVAATVTGEMQPQDIPVGSWVDLGALKAGDPDPLEVVVRIPEGRSKRGWYYTRRVLERIASEINTTGLPGILGHQDPDRVDREFPTPVTHWVGATIRDEGGKAVLYARGVVDKAAADLKRWIRANTVRQVSIYGVPTLERTATGETLVTDFQPLSIDWTPLNRAGMPTSVVAVGEMDFVGGDEPVNWREALKRILEALRSRETTLEAVVGEMGLSLDQVAQALAADQWARLLEAEQVVGEMATILGKSEAKAEDLVAEVRALKEQADQAAKAQRDALLDKVVGEMVAVEAVRPLVRRLVDPLVQPGTTEEEVRRVVGEMLQQEDVRKALDAAFAGWVPSGVVAQRAGEPLNGLAVRRERI